MVQLPTLLLLLGPMLAFVALANKKHSDDFTGFVLILISFGSGFILGWLAWSLLGHVGAYGPINELTTSTSSKFVRWARG
jgi:hypothetical protein